MSRSRKKNRFSSIAYVRPGEQKAFKQKEHRRERHLVTNKLSIGDIDGIPDPKQFGNEWAGPRDGKCYLSKTKENEEWLRK